MIFPNMGFDIVVIAVLLGCCGQAYSQAAGLQPGQFNLATGRRISATATCGEGEPELYCKLTGANLERGDQQQRVGHEKYFVINGQICDYCDANSADQSHPAENANDGTERWWQSPPLSRGAQFMEVNLTIDFNQEFHVAYLLLRMGNSPRPEVWTLLRSNDYGKTWQPWQHFAEPSDCESYFGVEPDQPILKDDDVICTSKYSRIVPLEGGEIVVSLVNDRPGRGNFLSNNVLQNWTKATNVRFQFQRMKTLLGHTTGVVRQDPTVTRRYYYSVRDISIGGLCVCNGHASSCDVQDPNEPSRQLCRCVHNTCGPYCDHCCPGFVQKNWKPAMENSSNACEPCNCHGHSTECDYIADVDEKHLSLDIHGNYEGGGVCRNCRDNTVGINCENCRNGYFHPKGKLKTDRDTCQVCRCDPRFSTGNCAEITGICECKQNFTGTNCDRCNIGYFDYPTCKPCECNYNGTINQVCNAGFGNCPCKPNYTGAKCDQCMDNFFDFPNCTACDCGARGTVPGTTCERGTGQCVCTNNYGGRQCNQCADGYSGPNCTPCDCDPSGTEKDICDKSSGVCKCKPGHTGPRCDQTAPGYFGRLPVAKCNCDPAGSVNDVCDPVSGRCPCKTNYSGRACDMCAAGYYKFPECLACSCDSYGTIGTTCDIRGQCQCKKNFVGKTCNACAEGFYNYPLCEGCNCNPAGLIASFGGCGKVEGELCQCKERVTGRICDKCKPGYWGLDLYNPSGCDECACNQDGTVSALSICDGRSGACPCKSNVEARQCTKCKDGFYKLDGANLHGCVGCGCDVGGAVSPVCDKSNGQCVCRPRINGKTCSQVVKLHYFPTLHHLKFEAEDGRAVENGPVQYEFKESDFPGYSWRGYAVMSNKQQQIEIPVHIRKPSLYRMLVRYVNLANTTARADVVVIPESNNRAEPDQKAIVDFLPTRDGKYASVGEGTLTNTFVLLPGQWHVLMKTSKPVLIDYIVLLPQAYYEATVLQEAVHDPCLYGQAHTCRNFTYPNLADKYIHVDPAVNSFYKKNGDTLKPVIDDSTRRGVKGALIDASQPQLTMEAEILPTEPHHLVLAYFTRELNGASGLNITVNNRTSTAPLEYRAALYNCPYEHVCRSVVLENGGKPAIFAPSDRYLRLTMTPLGTNGVQPDFVVTDLIAVPASEWHSDHVRPQSGCVIVDGACVTGQFPAIPDSNIVEAETDTQISHMRPEIPGLPAKVQTAMLYLTNQTSYLRGTTQRAGDHAIVVHYYQPNGAGAEFEAAVQGAESNPATLETHFCPSTSGCRAILRHAEGPGIGFRLGKDYSITIKGKDGHEVYLDYVIAVPANQYEPRFLHETPRDLATSFIEQCSKDYFEIDPDVKGFCRQATFSLASAFNNEAMQCECNLEGSTSFQCEELGGQCQCRTNVIGRKCNRCKSGYWGFPECRVCNCPFNSVCDPVSGACICPPRVTGERCDMCMPRTYGFHPITGCQECNCNPYGTNGSLDCEQETGTCFCKQNVGGRTCDKCITGYYSFPHCQACHYCDVRGATDAICDQQNGQCLCKENVAGPRCDMCKAGTFLLDAKNPLGCTKCFCSGVTSQCQPSAYSRVLLPLGDPQIELAKWTTLPALPVAMKSTGAEATVDTAVTSNREVYWVAPAEFLGNRVTSYGGKLTYSINVAADGATGSLSPDVILKGRNMTIHYLHDVQPVVGANHEVEVELTEGNFEHESGTKVSRDQFMMVLVALDALHIKAGYFPNPRTLSLNYVTLGGALPPKESNEIISGLNLAGKVEECVCPPQYTGSSCEDCAPHHYRSKTGPYLGICLACDCNNHAERCDPQTGQCINCLHNTTGERCDKCVEGFYGDATRGSPYDCMICACPIPIASNNFATSCDVDQDGMGIQCTCREGYMGDRCQYCAPGYFGQPEVPGGFCQPCKCNSNIDPNDPASCDPITGACLKCLNNTSGPECNTCREDFFGDPTRSACQVCDCDAYGTESCNTTDGTCKCWPNVEGLRCDRCAPDHWDFESGRGCSACNCQLGSKTKQCNVDNGQCDCQPGVIGKQCDRCASSYWNYSASGCTRCACATKYSIGESCDPITGHCSCLPGVTGAECDRCKPRHVLVENIGCEACGYCVHTLLDDFDDMNAKMDIADREFEKVSAAQFATIRLNRLGQTIGNLSQAVNFLTITGAPQTLLGFDTQLQAIESAVDKKHKQSGDARKTAEEKLKAADQARDELSTLLRRAGGARKNVTDLAQSFTDLETYLRQGPGSKVQESTVLAEPILSTLRNRKFDDYRGNASFELAAAKDTQGSVRAFNTEHNGTLGRAEALQKGVHGFQDKMKDLEKWSVNASETVAQARLKIEAVRENITDNVEAIEVLKTIIGDVQGNSSKKAAASQLYFTDAQTSFTTLDDQSQRLKDARDQLNTTNRAHFSDNRDSLPSLSSGKNHVRMLEHEADRLDNMFKPTRNAAAMGKKAASVYGDIVDDVAAARAAYDNSTILFNDITTASANVRADVGDSLAKSQKLQAQADQSKIDALKLRGTIDASRNKGQVVNDRQAETGQVIVAFRTGMQQVPKDDLKARLDDQTARANTADVRATEIQAQAERIIAELTGSPYGLNQKPDETVGHVAVQEIILAESAARQVPQDIPGFNDRITRADAQIQANEAAADDLGNKIAELRRKIELTRSLTNRIKVGMELTRSNSVQLKNPSDIGRASTYTHISMYFKTPERDGLLYYLGNEVGTSRRVKRDFSPITDDYMALEIQNGFVVLLFDLGSGPTRVEVRDKFVSDNQWHQVIVERIGKTATVRVISLPGPDGRREFSAEGATAGPNTVFNLNQENSTFFVGGMPLSFRLQTPVKNKRFAGFIEGLEFDMEPIGLWNQGNYTFDSSAPTVPQLAPERDQLLVPNVEEGIKLDGNGYAVYNLEGRVDVARDTAVILEMKTFDKQALLFMLGDDRSEEFFSVELNDGHVLFQYNLGSGTTAIKSPGRYDDGKWHAIGVERSGRRGVLQIDSENVANDTSPGHEDRLDANRLMFLGGHPSTPNTEITKQAFEGCVRSLEVNTRKVKLENTKEAKGALLGCPTTVKRMVTFSDSSAGYLAMPAVNVESSFQITLKFKTISPNGLLFLTSSEDDSQVLSLFLKEGRLVWASDDGRGQVSSVTTDLNAYWNGEWHYVSASKESNKMRLMIDDFEIVEAPQAFVDSLNTVKPLYFGGVPDDFQTTSSLRPQSRNFIGCIGDVVVNDRVQNFADSQERPGASYSACAITALPGQILPVLPPQPTAATLAPFWQPPMVTTGLYQVVTLATARPGIFISAVGNNGATTSTTTTTTTTTTTQAPTTAATRASTGLMATTVMSPQQLPINTGAAALTSCALPLQPDTDASDSTALQFGSRPESRQEFSTAPATFMEKSEFSVEFKTTAEDGVLMYVDDQKPSPIDFLAIYMKNGFLVYAFNPGSGPAVVRSPQRYNDGEWHTVSAVKRNRVGQLIVDGAEVHSSESPGTTEILNTKFPLYVGGTNGNKNFSKNLEGVHLPFNGCLRNFRLNGLAFGNPSSTVAVGPCSERTEPGAFFFQEGGHISLRDKFVVGQDLDISVEIRPRSKDGVILAVGTSRRRRDYLALQLVNGVVDFSFDNGGGVTRVNVSLGSPFSVCDGGWHTIHAVKSKYVATLIVDDQYEDVKIGPAGQSAADTDLPLFLGSLPASEPDMKTVVRKQFVGCMRNLKLNEQLENFANGRVAGSVLSNSCPIA